ncbi:acyl-CoA dehydrogenase family protein [Pseudonocardia oroxyli]|uniref:Acyl-CoA dehydrogenase n=1 Tax=Pseudonocardia oroxyli TaxID=366584 RepID=A0A1G8D9C4_PSEOR|nr:acyl-CoA dehydrogenase family protein [Pseudonocardia oroxyli]SDH53880.1 hypothetical protein SAMN05216377_12523 [Pseudonocardia oroxyli]
MDMIESSAEVDFRKGLRKFLSEELPQDLRHASTFAGRLEADRVLSRGGYLGYTWPEQFGGQGGSPAISAILDEERALAGIPSAKSPSRFGVNLLGPTLMTHGTPEQLDEFLPPIPRAETIWCQGFSEPDSGSDLASVRASLSDRGDHYVVNGNKTWTTLANHADWCYALVRSQPDAPRHRNLAFVLFDMRQPGVDVRPMVQTTGASEFNEMFLTDVRVEKRHVVGAVDEGWRVALTVLNTERSYGQLSRFRQYEAELRRLSALIARSDPAKPEWRARLVSLSAHITGIRNISYKITSTAEAGEDLGALASVAKLLWSTTHQSLADLGYEVAMETGEDAEYWLNLELETRAESIYAGTSEIQRNIVAERLLGLPR